MGTTETTYQLRFLSFLLFDTWLPTNGKKSTYNQWAKNRENSTTRTTAADGETLDHFPRLPCLAICAKQ
jgi:hypothetical protein